MPCYQPASFPPGFTTTGRTSYATEADCLNACKEGACCDGTTCSIKPQCQCQGTGQTFKGIGTTCTPNPCNLCDIETMSVSTYGTMSGLYRVSFSAAPCHDASYSVSAGGAGVLSRNDSWKSASSICPTAGMIERCAYYGVYSVGGGASLYVAVTFFSVGSDVRYSARLQVVDARPTAVAACTNSDGISATGGTAFYQGCSGVVGVVSSSGSVSVNLSIAPPLTVMGGNTFPGGGSVTLSFNPLP